MLDNLKIKLHNEYNLKSVESKYNTTYSYVSIDDIENLYNIIIEKISKYVDKEKIEQKLHIRPIHLKTFHPFKEPGILGIELDISISKYIWIVPISSNLDKFILYLDCNLMIDKENLDFINLDNGLKQIGKYVDNLESFGYLDNINRKDYNIYLKALKDYDIGKTYTSLGRYKESIENLNRSEGYINKINLISKKNSDKLKSNSYYLKFKIVEAKNNISKQKVEYKYYKNNIIKALEVNISNQNAIKDYFKYTCNELQESIAQGILDSRTLDYSRELRLLNDCVRNISMENLLEVYNDIVCIDNVNLLVHQGAVSKETLNLIIEVYENIFSILGMNEIYLVKVLLMLYTYSEEHLYIGYMFFKDHIKKYPETIELYAEEIADICINLNKYDEAEEYIKMALNLIEKLKLNNLEAKHEEFTKNKWALKNKLAMIYERQNRFYEAKNLMLEIVEESPNNTTYHNLGCYLMKLKEYDIAKLYLQKALLISQDERSYRIMADTLYFNGEYEKAIEYYKKTIAFAESAKTTFVFKDSNSQKVRSYASEDALLFDKKIAYENIIHSYIEIEDYINATAYHTLASKEFEFEESFIKINRLLSKLISYEENALEINKILENTIGELENEKKLASSQIGKVKEWAITLIKAQDKSSVLNNDYDDINWANFELELDNIANLMKNSQLDSTEISFSDIESEFRNKYKNISNKALRFLTTGEYLYRINENEFIDYAPVMIEYCKVVELELNNYLIRNKIIDDYKMLGYINKLLQNSDIYDITKYLNEIIVHRNESAHTASINRKKVDYIRDILFDKGFLDKILDKN